MSNDGKKKNIIKIVGVLLILSSIVVFVFGAGEDFPVWLFFLCMALFALGIALIVMGLITKKEKKVKSEFSNSVNETKKEYDSSKMKKIETKKEYDPSKMKTIKYDGIHHEETISFEVLEDNGGILKIDGDDHCLTNLFIGSSFAKNNEYADLPAEYTIGSFHSCINQNNLAILRRSGYGNNYYIDVNDVDKVEINVYIGSYIASNEGDFDAFDPEICQRYNLIIHTKAGASFDQLDYDISLGDDVKKYLEVLKKKNNNIVYEYKYTVYMTCPNYHSVKYDFGDCLNIKRYAIVSNGTEISLSSIIDYEINLDYADIANLNIDSFEDRGLCICVDTNNNDKYFFAFEDKDEATKFYSELKKHSK